MVVDTHAQVPVAIGDELETAHTEPGAARIMGRCERQGEPGASCMKRAESENEHRRRRITVALPVRRARSLVSAGLRWRKRPCVLRCSVQHNVARE